MQGNGESASAGVSMGSSGGQPTPASLEPSFSGGQAVGESFSEADVSVVGQPEAQTVFEDTNIMDNFATTSSSPHDKLVALSEMPDEEKPSTEPVDNKETELEMETPPDEGDKTKEETDEKVLMRLQRETLGLLMKRMSGSVDKNEMDKDVKELMAQLRFLLERLSQEEEKKSLTGAVVGLVLLLLTVGVDMEQKLEKEVKAA